MVSEYELEREDTTIVATTVHITNNDLSNSHSGHIEVDVTSGGILYTGEATIPLTACGGQTILLVTLAIPAPLNGLTSVQFFITQD